MNESLSLEIKEIVMISSISLILCYLYSLICCQFIIYFENQILWFYNFLEHYLNILVIFVILIALLINKQ